MTLPVLIRRPSNKLMYFVYWGPFIALYQLVNRWPLREPMELPFSRLDQAIPFVPELLPVYIAYIPFYWWTIGRSEDDQQLNRILYTAYLQLLLSVPFFVLFPVRMPVEQFYPSVPFGWADVLWRWFDVPNNCFPSLHVSNSLLLLHFNWRRPHRLPYAAASVAIIASTVLVKQHYLVDVLGGGGAYLASRVFLDRLVVKPKRAVAEYRRAS
jgi:membrane-associated phospholipid phosphatase